MVPSSGSTTRDTGGRVPTIIRDERQRSPALQKWYDNQESHSQHVLYASHSAEHAGSHWIVRNAPGWALLPPLHVDEEIR